MGFLIDAHVLHVCSSGRLKLLMLSVLRLAIHMKSLGQAKIELAPAPCWDFEATSRAFCFTSPRSSWTITISFQARSNL